MASFVEISNFNAADFAASLPSGTTRAYAVIDACLRPMVPERAQRVGPERALCLYKGQAAHDYWAVAPYLFQVDAETWSWIGEQLADQPWGILCQTPLPLGAVQTHLRRFLTVQSPDGGQWLFRFYDPRVLPQFLETAPATQVTEMFGPLECFHAAAWTFRLPKGEA